MPPKDMLTSSFIYLKGCLNFQLKNSIFNKAKFCALHFDMKNQKFKRS
ncbi:hypothetical protein HMPREF9444_01398 [Succinatimonas hippei YIT 12066]|uniref:Uncharacterized protein n=1 Tax=Succinatimonas hippei (strain DSM 22608 / JCM 16073 / KCTC 15190 / YIT 12066) TaxID=762983 RepID=E8LKZ3_SUCHY|nr:hypothetical protein HMPREF9444_01398 [Succinatimonas hippei YIT 12066]